MSRAARATPHGASSPSSVTSEVYQKYISLSFGTSAHWATQSPPLRRNSYRGAPGIGIGARADSVGVGALVVWDGVGVAVSDDFGAGALVVWAWDGSGSAFSVGFDGSGAGAWVVSTGSALGDEASFEGSDLSSLGAAEASLDGVADAAAGVGDELSVGSATAGSTCAMQIALATARMDPRVHFLKDIGVPSSAHCTGGEPSVL